jgi:hypothetical protein
MAANELSEEVTGSDKATPVLPEWSGYSGEPFNLTERRPLQIVSETPDTFTANGFYYRGAFWTAVIPKTGVAEIIAQRLNFSKPKKKPDGTRTPSVFFLNHVQARLKMQPDSPLLLYPVGERPTSNLPVSEPAHRIHDFVYTVEAVGPHGRRWNVADSLLGNLALVQRFLSTCDVAFERIMQARMTVLQSPPLPLEADVRDQLLQAAVRRSHEVGLAKPYFMIRLPFSANNCTSEQINIVDAVLQLPPWQHFFHRLPVHPRAYLKLRGLWREGQALPTLNEEMADWMASDEAKQRREIYSLKKKQAAPVEDVPDVPLRKNIRCFFKALRA